MLVQGHTGMCWDWNRGLATYTQSSALFLKKCVHSTFSPMPQEWGSGSLNRLYMTNAGMTNEQQHIQQQFPIRNSRKTFKFSEFCPNSPSQFLPRGIILCCLQPYHLFCAFCEYDDSLSHLLLSNGLNPTAREESGIQKKNLSCQ